MKPPATADKTSEGSRARWAWIYAGLALLLFLVYAPSLRGGFIWDDKDNIVGNGAVTSVEGLDDIWLRPGATMNYYPLFYTSFWLDHRLWGDRPEPYRAVNILLHAANAALLMLLLRRLGVRGWGWAGVLFALHPICVESVAWITERKNLLSLLFYLASMTVFCRFAGLDRKGEKGSPGRTADYLASLGLFLLALLSKTMTVTLPAALLVLMWWKGRLKDRGLWLSLVPFFLLSAMAAQISIMIESDSLGARGDDWNFGPVAHLAIAGRILWFYLLKTAFPDGQVFFYPRWHIDEDPSGLMPGVLFCALLGLCLWPRANRGLFVGLALYAGTLFPVLGFFNVYMMRFSFVGDHLAYHAVPALFALAGAGMAALPWRRASAVLGGLAAALLAVLSWIHMPAYRSEEALWRHTLEKNPASWIAHNNLAGILLREGQASEARRHYRDAVVRNPLLAEGYCNLGILSSLAGDDVRAEAQYRLGLRSPWPNPKLRYNLGAILLKRGQIGEALVHLRRAAEIDPGFGPGHAAVAHAEFLRGNLDEAARLYLTAIRLSPDRPEFYRNLALIYLKQGNGSAALGVLQAGIAAHPADDTLRSMAGKLSREK